MGAAGSWRGLQDTLGSVSLQQAESVFTIIGVSVAAVALVIAAVQSRMSRAIARGDFLLRLDETKREHDDIHQQLQSGAWTTGKPTPAGDERGRLLRYLGLFERIKVLIDSSVVDGATIDKFYGYCLNLILWNEGAHDLARSNPDGWKDYLALQEAIDRLHERGKCRGRRITRTRRPQAQKGASRRLRPWTAIGRVVRR
jgi:hypothetical protein